MIHFFFITSHAFQKYEVFKIFSYYNVNLTVINLTCTGFNDPLCTFAGITAYSLNNHSYTEITTECHSSNNIFASRDVYSKSNETANLLFLQRIWRFKFNNTIVQDKVQTCDNNHMCFIISL